MARDDARSHRRDLRAGGRRYETPRGRILEAVIALADADAERDADYHVAWCRLYKTLRDVGWTPPAGPGGDTKDPQGEGECAASV